MAKRKHGTIQFTNSVIDSLPTPKKDRAFYSDSNVNGLTLRTYPTGRKSFYLYKRAQGRLHNIKIGDFPDFPIAKARRKAKILLGQLLDGVDVLDARRNEKLQGVSLKEVFDDYIENSDLKDSTIQDYTRAIKWAFNDWLDKPLIAISLEKLEVRHQQRGKRSKARANNAARVLRALFNYAIPKYKDSSKNPVITFNPAQHIKQFKVPRRTTVLKPHQLPTWYRAVMDLSSDRSPLLAETARDLLLFLLFTGLRSTEAMSLRWDCVDLKDKSFVLVDTKNRTSPTLPLTTFTSSLLEERQRKSVWVFPAQDLNHHMKDIREWVKKVCEELEFTFTPHDLRRTFLTVAESIDISQVAYKRLVNHITQDVTEGYIIHDIGRLREPAQRITDYLLELVHD